MNHNISDNQEFYNKHESFTQRGSNNYSYHKYRRDIKYQEIPQATVNSFYQWEEQQDYDHTIDEEYEMNYQQ